MKGMSLIIAGVCAFTLVARMHAAENVQTAEGLEKAMKKIGPAQQALSKAIQAMAYTDAKKQLEVIEVELKNAQKFWVTKKRADATKFTVGTLEKVDSLKKLLGAKSPDPMAVANVYREVGIACAACHRVYRTTDNDNKFILKPGTVD